MKALSATVLGLAAGFALTGCSSPHGPADEEDGTWCGSIWHYLDDKTFIDVVYAGDGTPSADPATCEVKRGTRITWRGPSGNPAVFEIDFPSGTPGTVAGEGGLSSLPGGGTGRQKVVILATGPKGTHKYGIDANGKKLDPDVIIK